MSIHIYMYIYISISIYIYIYRYRYRYIRIRICILFFISFHMYMCMYIYIYTQHVQMQPCSQTRSGRDEAARRLELSFGTRSARSAVGGMGIPAKNAGEKHLHLGVSIWKSP